MPQLAKRGKHAFGWARVGDSGRIPLPPEAVAEYGLEDGQKLVLMPGSRRSGGLGLAPAERLRETPLGAVLHDATELGAFRVAEGQVVEHGGKACCWAELRGGAIAARGPVVGEARRHPDLPELR